MSRPLRTGRAQEPTRLAEERRAGPMDGPSANKGTVERLDAYVSANKGTVERLVAGRDRLATAKGARRVAPVKISQQELRGLADELGIDFLDDTDDEEDEDEKDEKDEEDEDEKDEEDEDEKEEDEEDEDEKDVGGAGRPADGAAPGIGRAWNSLRRET
jgi:hypothetical protein